MGKVQTGLSSQQQLVQISGEGTLQNTIPANGEPEFARQDGGEDDHNPVLSYEVQAADVEASFERSVAKEAAIKPKDTTAEVLFAN